MSIIRVQHDRNKPYLMVSKKTVTDAGLSLAGRGFLMVMLALPDNWSFNIRGLSKIAHVSKDTATRHLKELMTAGYCKRTELPKVGGRFSFDYTIFENPEEADNAICASGAEAEPAEMEGQTTEAEAPEDFDDDEGTRKHSYQQYFVKLYASLYRARFKSNAPWAAKKDYSLLALDYKRLGKEGLEAAIRWLFEHATRMQGFGYGSIHTFLPEAEKALADEARKLRLLKTCRACGKQSDTTGQDCPKCGEPDAFVMEAQHAAQ